MSVLRSPRIARAALYASVLLASASAATLGLVLWMPVVPAPPQFVAAADSSARRDGGSMTDSGPLASIVDSDLFSPARQAPEVAFRLAATSDRPTPQPAQSASLTLVGTVVRPGARSFAICQLDGSQTRMVFPGQRIAGWELLSVAQGSAEFLDPTGHRVTLRVSRTEQ